MLPNRPNRPGLFTNCRYWAKANARPVSIPAQLWDGYGEADGERADCHLHDDCSDDVPLFTEVY